VFSRRLTGGKTPSILPSGACAQGFEILMPRLLPSPVPYSRSMEAVNCKPLNTVFVRRGETTGWGEIHAFGSLVCSPKPIPCRTLIPVCESRTSESRDNSLTNLR
jgi:hypothetical protein